MSTEPLVVMGDPLQLPPIPKTTSLLQGDLSNVSQEQKAGAAMLAGFDNVYMLKKTMRFKDPLLRSILTKMRTAGGCLLTEEERSALLKTKLDRDESMQGSQKKDEPLYKAAHHPFLQTNLLIGMKLRIFGA